MEHEIDMKPVPVHEHIDGCRWPIGEHPTYFCNSARKSDRKDMYCTYHAKMAYVPIRSVTSRGNNRNTW